MPLFMVRTEREGKRLNELVEAEDFRGAELFFRLCHGTAWPIIAIETYTPILDQLAADAPDTQVSEPGPGYSDADLWGAI